MKISENARALAARMNECCGTCIPCPPEISDLCDEDARFAQKCINDATAEKDKQLAERDAKIERLRYELVRLQDVVGTEDAELIEQALAGTLVFDLDDDEYPDEWTYDADGNPTCTAFVPEASGEAEEAFVSPGQKPLFGEGGSE